MTDIAVEPVLSEDYPGYRLHLSELRPLPSRGSTQRRVYDLVVQEINRVGRPPSTDDIARHLGCHRSRVKEATYPLIRAGLLVQDYDRNPDKAVSRSLRPSALAPLIPSILLALLLLVGPWTARPTSAMEAGGCDWFFVTAYLRWSPPMNPLTADGTPIWTTEPIVAASLDLPIDAVVDVGGWGHYRVADRFGDPDLWRRIDVAVWTRQEAMDWTGWYHVCRVK